MAGDPDAPSALVPVVVLAGIVLALVLGWWLFPRFQAWVHYNDCIASGQMAC